MLYNEAGNAVHGVAVWGYGTGDIGTLMLFTNTPNPSVGLSLRGYYDVHATRAGMLEHGGLVMVELTSLLFHAMQNQLNIDPVLACVTPTGVHLLSPWAMAMARYPHAVRTVFPDGRPIIVDDDSGIAFGRGTVRRGGREEDVVFQIDVFRPHHFCDAMRFVASILTSTPYECALRH